MIIFLDIDGVIATWKSYHQCKKITESKDLLDRSCIKVLNLLTDKLNAKIVVSSTWRWDKNVNKKLKDAGVKAEIIGHTPTIHAHGEKLWGSRGHEIITWLENYPLKEDYLVLDDEVFDMEKIIPKDKIIHVKNGMSEGGLTIEIVNKILADHVKENK